MIQAFVGAGGKTSLIRKLANQYRAEGKKVFVTTTTHMFIEEDTVLSDDAEGIICTLEQKGYVHAGIPDGRKIKALSEDTYRKVCEKADVVLVEADGSKHMPIKFPEEHEPVIPGNATEIVVVCGLHALGQPLIKAAHRLELVKKCLNEEINSNSKTEHVSDQTIVEAKHIKKVALDAGFDLCGVTSCQSFPINRAAFDIWLKNGYDSSLQYMRNNVDMRFDVGQMVEGARSVVVCAVSYKSEISGGYSAADKCKIASYACNRDYHKTLKKMLKAKFRIKIHPLPCTAALEDAPRLLQPH